MIQMIEENNIILCVYLFYFMGIGIQKENWVEVPLGFRKVHYKFINIQMQNMIEYEVKFKNGNTLIGKLQLEQPQPSSTIKQKICEIQLLNSSVFLLDEAEDNFVVEGSSKVVLIEQRKSEQKGIKPSSIFFEEESMIYDENQKFLYEQPEKPPKVVGQVRKCNSFFSCMTSAKTMVLNFHKISIFRNKHLTHPQLQFELIDIKFIRSYKKKNYYFIQIKMKNQDTFDFQFINKEVCTEWLGYLDQAMDYCHYLSERKNLSTKQAFTQFYTLVKKKQIKTVLLDNSMETASTYNFDQKPENATILNKENFIKISDFTISHKIGKGAFSIVYKAEKNGKSYALKQLDKEALFFKQQMKYAITELEILKKCTKCPFIIPLHYAFQTYQNLYLAIKYTPHGTLGEFLEKKKKLSYAESFQILCQLVAAIQFLHENNILYRDLKPDNILLDDNGHIMLIDFGLSIQQKTKEEFAESFVGTPLFMVPQRLEGSGKVNFKGDIYGVGCIFYMMLHGEPPFSSDNFSSIVFNIKNVQVEYDKNLNKLTKLFLKETLQKNPQKRLNNMSFHPIFEGVDWKKVMKKSQSVIKLENEEKLNMSDVHYKIDVDYTAETYPKNKVADWEFP